MSFIHLRVHSEYSFLRGGCRLEPLVQRAKELGMPAVALTDYSMLHGAVRFTALAGKHGIQPILGAEFTLACGLPLVLLVRDRTGWQNLLCLVNRIQLAVPKIAAFSPYEMGQYAAGLTAVLHTRGEGIPFGEESTLRTAARALAELSVFFGDELYLGLEDAGLTNEARLNGCLAKMAQELNVPLVATHNVHYVLPGEDASYRMVNCIRTNRPLAGACQDFLPGADYDLKTPAEMVRRLGGFPGACENTLRLAKRCQFILTREGMQLPAFTLPGGEDPGHALHRLCGEGLAQRGLKGEEAVLRLNRELAVILPKGLASYFLIVRDLVCYAREQGIPVGPGRGSAGGSLVAYLLGITQVDPLKHGLYFERFLSADRADFPDIDLDVCQRRREELLAYMRARYGEGYIAQVSTFSTLGARAAVREVGKVLDMTQQRISAVAEALPHYVGRGGIDAAVSQYPEFMTSRLKDNASQAVLKGARRLEGLCRHLSTHASGVVIGAGSLMESVPLCRGPAGEVLTQWDKDDVEAMGFLKIDVLGSRNLTIIHDTLASVKEKHGSAPQTEEIPLDDKKTYAAMQRGESLGCFQLESAGMRRILRQLAPEKLEDIIHLLSLYRPGPWESGMVDAFIRRRHGKEEVSCAHPAIGELVADTYGVVLYQEQLMRIACELGGYSPGEADRLRREMGRRTAALQEVHRPRFTAGAIGHGLTSKEADELFEHLCRFAGYSFNKAHSAAYALVSYWTAYLKVHYPVEFYAALLSVGFGYYGPSVYVHEARMRGIEILPPHVNASTTRFNPEGNAIRAALHLVHDLGGRGVATVLAARENGKFASLQDFCHRVGRSALRRSAVVNLIKAGAFDGLGLNRRQALACMDDILKGTHRQPGQMSVFDLLLEEAPMPALPEFSAEEKDSAEAGALGMSLSTHPLARYRARLLPGCVPLARLPSLAPDTAVTVGAVTLARSRRRLKRGGVMLTLFICDESGFAEAVFFPDTYKRLLYRLGESALLLTGKTSTDGDAIVVTDAVPLSDVTLIAEEKECTASK